MTDDDRPPDATATANPDDDFGTVDEIEEFVEAYTDGVVEVPEASEDLSTSDDASSES